MKSEEGKTEEKEQRILKGRKNRTCKRKRKKKYVS